MEAISGNTTLSTSTVPVEDSLTNRNLRVSFLAIILLLGFLTNLVLMVTIISSSSLRSVLFHCHVLNLSANHLVTCLLILPLTIGYSATGDWDYGDHMCRASAHILLTVTIGTCLSILMMNVDRVIAIKNPEKYSTRVSMCKTVFVIIFVWMVAILFPIPLSLGITPVTQFNHRYICSIDKGASIDYLLSLYITCFALPPVTGVLLFVYIAREALSEREAQSTGSHQISLSSLWPEVQAAGIVFVIFLCWIVTELPFVALTSIHQYSYSDALTESDELQAGFTPPEQLDTIFVWLKFCNTFLSPLAVFKLRKEVWLQLKDLMLRRNRNSVIDSSPRQEKSETGNRKPPANSSSSQSNNVSYNPKSAAPFVAPTIRATRDGLHIHGDVESDGSIFFADMNLTGKSSELGLPIHTRTDIENLPDLNSYSSASRAQVGGGGAVEVDEDTSDYETDPYSQSDPISVRSTGAAGRTNQSYIRGSEDGGGGQNFRTKAHSISHDSGNGSASSSVTKKKRRRKAAEKALSGEDNSPDYPDAVHQSSSYMETNIDYDLGHEPESAAPRGDDEPGVDAVAEFVRPVKRKRKKKRNKDVAVDAETNTTQTVSVLELIERRQIPPPHRLEPLPQTVMTALSTPPLRSKYPLNRESAQLPPSGAPTDLSSSASRRKHRSGPAKPATVSVEEHPAVVNAEPESQRRKKKSNRPRKPSGDSNKPLMSSNTSSEMHSVVNESQRSKPSHTVC